MSFARFFVCVALIGLRGASGAAQDCFGLNTGASKVIYLSGREVPLPPAGGKVAVPCTQTIRNVVFSISFAAGAERYFEDSTQFVGVLHYKSSTFILGYDKVKNIFRLSADQSLGDGTYTLTLSAIMCTPSSANCNNCFVQYTFEAEFVPDPAFSVEVSSVPDPAVLTCWPGSQVVLSGTPPPHNGFTAQWSRLMGIVFVDIPGAVQPQYVATFSGTYLYTLTGPAGCKSSNLVPVKPPERPEIQVEVPQQKLNSCVQALVGVTIVDSSAAGNLLISWTASSGGVILDGSNTLSPTIGTPGVYTITATRLDNGCADTAAVNVALGNVPAVQVNIENLSATDVLDCKTLRVVLEARAALSEGIDTFVFLWSNGTADEQITAEQPGVYSVTVTAINSGCIGYADKAVFQNIKPPSATVASSRDTVCAGESAVLSATSPDPAIFRWSNGTTGPLLTVTPSIDGPNLYTVTVTSTLNGCSAVFEKVIARLAYPPLTCLPAAITLSHGQRGTINCTTSPLAQLQWTATATNVSGIPSSGIGPIQGRLFELSSMRAPGQAVFIVSARQGPCSSIPAEVVVMVTPPDAVEGIYIPEVITPDGDGQNDTWDIVLPSNSPPPSAYELTVYNRQGAVVWQNTLATPLPAEKYPDGTYFYHLTTPQGAVLRGAVTLLRRKK